MKGRQRQILIFIFVQLIILLLINNEGFEAISKLKQKIMKNYANQINIQIIAPSDKPSIISANENTNNLHIETRTSNIHQQFEEQSDDEEEAQSYDDTENNILNSKIKYQRRSDSGQDNYYDSEQEYNSYDKEEKENRQVNKYTTTKYDDKHQKIRLETRQQQLLKQLFGEADKYLLQNQHYSQEQ